MGFFCSKKSVYLFLYIFLTFKLNENLNSSGIKIFEMFENLRKGYKFIVYKRDFLQKLIKKTKIDKKFGKKKFFIEMQHHINGFFWLCSAYILTRAQFILIAQVFLFYFLFL